MKLQSQMVKWLIFCVEILRYIFVWIQKNGSAVRLGVTTNDWEWLLIIGVKQPAHAKQVRILSR